MNRNMKATIASVFDGLARHASLRGSVVPALPVGAYRTIFGDADEQARLVGVVAGDMFRANSHVAMGVFQYNDEYFVGLMGFDFEPELPELSLADVDAGVGLVMLSEFAATPKASAPEIANVVGAASSVDKDYIGHDFAAIQRLYPSLQLFDVMPGSMGSTGWPILLKAASSEAAMGSSWIGVSLQQAIHELAGLEAREFPYEALCRAVFDLDPRSLFMALYRCVEATYARDACESLRTELGLEKSWYEIATALDRALGWRAPEASSINRTLEHADEADLHAICGCLKVEPTEDMPVAAGRAIYKLRNKIVHFRAGDDQNYAAAMDWELLCTHLARIVGGVYGSAFRLSEADVS